MGLEWGLHAVTEVDHPMGPRAEAHLARRCTIWQWRGGERKEKPAFRCNTPEGVFLASSVHGVALSRKFGLKAAYSTPSSHAIYTTPE